MTTAQQRLDQILPSWYELLTQWSLDGSLVAAATEALVLDGSNAKADAKGQLQSLASQWSVRDFSVLPPIVLLSDADISGAQGAYSASTGTIYLNQEWLLIASADEIQRVLTEELGHHLDNQLNVVDTNGDEGALFSLELLELTFSDATKRNIQAEDDHVQIFVNGQRSEAEAATSGSDSIWRYATATGDSPYFSSVVPLIDGSSLVTGEFGSSTGGAATFGETTLTSAGKLDLFVAKINADGTYAWTIQAGGAGVDRASSIAAFSDGSSLITGSFAGSATFGSTTLSTDADNAIFAAKINADGSFAWATQADGGISNFSDNANSITAMSDGSALITGYFNNTAIFGGTTLTSAGISDVFVAKLNADGSFAWATKAGGIDFDAANSITSLGDGSSLITGYFRGTATFGGTTLISAGEYDIFVAKLNADGSFAWATRAGDIKSEGGASITSLGDGSSLITGSFLRTVTFGGTTLTSAGIGDVFVAKLNADGSFAWATKAGGIDNDGASSIISLGDGSSLITGSFQGTATFGGRTLTSAGVRDVFVAKLNADGSFAWATQAFSQDSLFGSSGTSITALDDGSSLITGTFRDAVILGDITLTSVGGPVSFVAQLSPNGTWIGPNVISGSNAEDKLNGTESSDVIKGYEANDILFGGAGDDVLEGEFGNDYLDGGVGIDILSGGAGNDTYIVDNTGDVVSEGLSAGTDTVQASVSHTLRSNVENLTLTGSGAINGTGNTLINRLTGNAANNILNGGAGVDTMIGGAGNDTYIVDNTGDVVSEGLSAGTDTVQASVSHTLRSNVENLTLTGSGAINGTGNGLNNVITGNGVANTLVGSTGNDSLNGGAGNDYLSGGAGIDRLTGGTGADRFRFDTAALITSSNRDLITDFSRSSGDKLSFSKAVYAGFGTATGITSAQLRAGVGVIAASNTTQRFLYDTTTGILRFDRDGSGSSYSALQVAQLGSSTIHPTLAYTDFQLS